MRELDLSQIVWRTSSYSGQAGGNCVEVLVTETRTAVRDSKNAPGPALTFPTASWGGFLTSV